MVERSGQVGCRVAVSYGVRDLLVGGSPSRGPGLPAEAVTSPAGLVAERARVP